MDRHFRTQQIMYEQRTMDETFINHTGIADKNNALSTPRLALKGK
jgi:hypothetical protein